MEQWRLDLDRGISALSRHAPDVALKRLQHALRSCPITNSRELERILFYLGVSLKKLGMDNSALKSWSAAQKLKKAGYARKMLRRFSNDYGMARQSTCEMDDWKAFYCVQLARYLDKKRSHQLGTRAERDMIGELILDYWKDLKAARVLEGKNTEEKLAIFKEVKVVFPYFVVPQSSGGDQIDVNFASKRRFQPEDRCTCGSGLPYKMCCGRTPGEDELLSGYF
jgi:tetratricopeptide (TPR) repeat protein